MYESVNIYIGNKMYSTLYYICVCLCPVGDYVRVCTLVPESTLYYICVCLCPVGDYVRVCTLVPERYDNITCVTK